MGSSKTATALMTRFNYMEKGYNVLLLKPAIDVRDDSIDEGDHRITKIRSRIGLEAVAETVSEQDNLVHLYNKRNNDDCIDVIIVDECQFLTPLQVEQLKFITEIINVPVLCFGLRTDFQSKMFPGSMRLFELASSIQEIKHICKCGNKSIINARLDSAGRVITQGSQVEIGGDDKYEAMCWKCWQYAQKDHSVYDFVR